ncbi:MAG: hypothetical protein WAN65_32150 [Candidatus Sulfotelmatobacter sp.]
MDVTNAGRGDKDMLLVDKNNNVMVAFENGGKQHVSVSTNGGASFTSSQVNVAPSGVCLATGAVLDTQGNAYFAWSGTTNNGTGPTTFYVQRSNNLFSTYSVSTVDESEGGPQVTGAGWDYWGGSIQIGIQPKAPPVNDRLIATYNAGAGSSGAPERIYTKQSTPTRWARAGTFPSTHCPGRTERNYRLRRAASGMVFHRSRERLRS